MDESESNSVAPSLELESPPDRRDQVQIFGRDITLDESSRRTTVTKDMKIALALLVCNAATITCVIMAGLISLEGRSGWGWFLLVGLLISCVPASKDDK